LPADKPAVCGGGQRYTIDPIIEKLETGMSSRDALVSVLFGLDYEHDHLKTPRIASGN